MTDLEEQSYGRLEHNTRTKHIPLTALIIDMSTGQSCNFGRTSGGSSILFELGSLHLEFVYLSALTGDGKYSQKVGPIRRFLDGMTEMLILKDSRLLTTFKKFNGEHTFNYIQLLINQISWTVLNLSSIIPSTDRAWNGVFELIYWWH